MDEVKENDLKSDEVSQIIKKEQRQLNAAREARAAVERTFSSMDSAQKDRSFAQLIRNKLNNKKLARRFEAQAVRRIASNKNVAIYDPNNPERIK